LLVGTARFELALPDGELVLQTSAANRICLMPVERGAGIEPAHDPSCSRTPSRLGYPRVGGRWRNRTPAFSAPRFSGPLAAHAAAPSMSKNCGGRGEGRTLMHMALVPKTSVSTNSTTRPLGGRKASRTLMPEGAGLANQLGYRLPSSSEKQFTGNTNLMI